MGQDYDDIRYETDGPVAVITIDRPERYNAFRGKTVELVFYPREGHGLGEYYHQIDKIRREHEWIVKYTLGNRVVQ